MIEDAAIRIAIADDHQMFAEAMRHIVESNPGFEVVGTANDGDDLLKLINRQRPDVALVDISMPGTGARAIAREVGQKPNGPKLIALTMHLERGFAELLLATGFSGYIIKDAAVGELLNAIRHVMAGNQFVSQAILDVGQVTVGNAVRLTARELECLRAAGEGLQNKAIGERLSITERTVKFHFENILRKLEANNRSEAVAIGRRKSLI
ncbi:MAG: response regulator transcription factor [Alphaproteobacteria bacterium]|nr:response regulator transcription factor [Alphaproteobacteria bacterium]